MAKLPALVSALAECDERDRATLDHIARVIREAGLIPTTKRGGGASEMTVREAANLLIAANASESPKEAAMAVAHYRSLEGQDISPGVYDEKDGVYTRRDHEEGGIFARITEAANFGEALETLIDGVPELLLSLLAYIDDAYGGNHSPEQLAHIKRGMIRFGEYAGVHVTFSRPRPYATIRIVAWPRGEERVHYEWRFRVDTKLFMNGFYPERGKDRATTVTVGLRTLLKLFGAVFGEEPAQVEYA